MKQNSLIVKNLEKNVIKKLKSYENLLKEIYMYS